MGNSNARLANAQTNGAYRMDKQCSTTQTSTRGATSKCGSSYKARINVKGIYKIRVITNQRTLNTRLLRQ